MSTPDISALSLGHKFIGDVSLNKGPAKTKEHISSPFNAPATQKTSLPSPINLHLPSILLSASSLLTLTNAVCFEGEKEFFSAQKGKTIIGARWRHIGPAPSYQIDDLWQSPTYVNGVSRKNTFIILSVTGGDTTIMVIYNGKSAFYGYSSGEAANWPNHNCLTGIQNINTVTRRL